MEQQREYQELKNKLGDKLWRLNNLYFIKDKQGNKVKFKLNWAQSHYYNSLHYFNVILKARQLGFSTFTLIYFLDNCLFNSNQSAGVIADIKENAEDLFDNKVKFAYDNLPALIKRERTATQDSARKLTFNNGSSFTVGTSLRGGTYQMLLVSEYGKISAKFPDKAREIKTGALNTIEAGQLIIVESTAEGKAGEFFELCEQARNLKNQGRQITRLEPKFHFYAWFDNPDYKLTDAETAITPVSKEIATYLQPLNLKPNQVAWYAAKEQVMGDDMRREYPSTPEEAFEGSLEGAYYAKEMALVRQGGQISFVPYDRRYPVKTFWDIGQGSDQMSILAYQEVNNRKNIINYHESSNQGWDFYARLLTDWGYNYSEHWFPHDGNKKIIGTQVMTTKQLAEMAGIRPIKVQPVTKSVADDIRNFCKPFLPQCWFDETKCALLIKRLDNYKRKWDKINAMWLNEPVHNEASHGADSYRTLAVVESRPKQTLDKSPAPGYYTETSYARRS